MLGWPLKLVALVAALGGVAHADPGVRKLVVTPPEQFTHAAPAAAISPYLYLNRCIGGCTIIGGGTNDASSNKTTLLAAGTYTLGEFANAFGQTTTTATKGTCLNPDGSATMTTCTDDTGCASFGAGAICDTADYEWNLVVQCAKEVYSPYALTVTDTRPTGVTYSMQMVAGLGMSVGQPDGVVGIAPLASDCSAQNNVISFAFSNDHPMIQRVNEICWTVAQESAHTFGLDHEYEYLDGTSACNDPMTYRRDCGGEKFFRNKDARCGGPDDGLGPAPRACKCGGTQNSHQKLLKLLGPGESVIPPPTVAITFPTSPSVQNNWNTVANAGSRRGVESVELWLNNYRWSGHSGAMFESLGQPNPSIYSLVAPNGVPNGGIKIIVRAFDDLGFEGDASMLVQKGASCTDDSTCAVGQKCNTGAETDTVAAGGCFWDPPVGLLGDSCEYPQYCQSDVCVGPQNQQICTKSCNPQVASGDGSCPSDYECDTASDGKSYCFPASGGCCSASSGSVWPHAALAMFVLVMIVRRRNMRGVVAAAVVGLVAVAHADTTASTTISQVMVLEPGDPSYKLFHGAVWLEFDKAQWNYRWGGLQCKGRELGDTSIQLLFAAFRAGDPVKLEYVVSDYKDKQYRCVTGFTIAK